MANAFATHAVELSVAQQMMTGLLSIFDAEVLIQALIALHQENHVEDDEDSTRAIAALQECYYSM